MATQYIQGKHAGTEIAPTEILNDSIGRQIIQFLVGKYAGIAYDQVSGELKYNDNGTIRSLVSSVGPVEVLTAARVLTMADSGGTFALALAGGFNITLPALAGAAGFHAKFIVQVAPTTAYTITSAEGDNIAGSVYSADGAAGDTEAAFTADVITLVAAAAVIGDQVEIDGLAAGWAATAHVAVSTGATFTG